MKHENEGFEVERSFGLGVLLKLTKKNKKGIEIASTGNKFKSNVPLNELKDAVNDIIQRHNIKLKIK